jgi:prepilin-type N-terminal cleavage/methylation domain-containing protein
MKSHKTFRGNGFTLIEILVVVAIMTAIVSLGVIVGIDSYQRTSFGTERDLVVNILQQARSRSLNNVDQIKHGVKVEPTSYVVFKGDTSLSDPATHEIIPKRAGITTGGLTEIVFDQLNGNVEPSQTGDITISDGIRNGTISINHEGRIDW